MTTRMGRDEMMAVLLEIRHPDRAFPARNADEADGADEADEAGISTAEHLEKRRRPTSGSPVRRLTEYGSWGGGDPRRDQA